MAAGVVDFGLKFIFTPTKFLMCWHPGSQVLHTYSHALFPIHLSTNDLKWHFKEQLFYELFWVEIATISKTIIHIGWMDPVRFKQFKISMLSNLHRHQR